LGVDSFGGVRRRIGGSVGGRGGPVARPPLRTCPGGWGGARFMAGAPPPLPPPPRGVVALRGMLAVWVPWVWGREAGGALFEAGGGGLRGGGGSRSMGGGGCRDAGGGGGRCRWLVGGWGGGTRWDWGGGWVAGGGGGCGGFLRAGGWVGGWGGGAGGGVLLGVWGVDAGRRGPVRGAVSGRFILSSPTGSCVCAGGVGGFWRGGATFGWFLAAGTCGPSHPCGGGGLAGGLGPLGGGVRGIVWGGGPFPLAFSTPLPSLPPLSWGRALWSRGEGGLRGLCRVLPPPPRGAGGFWAGGVAVSGGV